MTPDGERLATIEAKLGTVIDLLKQGGGRMDDHGGRIASLEKKWFGAKYVFVAGVAALGVLSKLKEWW